MHGRLSRGTRVGPGERYEIEGALGEGGMGVVYRALDHRLHGRPCAIKVLNDARGRIARARFEREIELTASLRSPHVVQVTDTGQLSDDRPFIVMDLLEGQTLDGLLDKQGRLSVERAMALFDGVLIGLGAAHAAGIIHRDVKPSNIFVVRDDYGREVPVLMDFGVARPFALGEQNLTGRNVIVGTPAYMAPEQVADGRIDGRADLYAAGVLFYRMLAGRHPFDAQRVSPSYRHLPRALRLIWCHLNLEPAPIDGLSPALNALLARAMAKRPSARFGSAIGLMGALRATPEGRGLPALDPRLTEQLVPATVPVDVSDFDLDVADTLYAPEPDAAAAAPAEPLFDDGLPPWLLGLGIAFGIMAVGALAAVIIW